MVSDNAALTTTDYAGAFIYENSSLKFVNHTEGYIEPDGAGGYSYVYQYKDHLGNVRLSYTDANGDEIVETSEIRGEKHYYPFGLLQRGYNSQVQGTYYPYGFGGKEEQAELDLNWLDFSARNYDAALGRWMNLDPLAEDMCRHSPYNYAFNNPINFIDPDGMMPHGIGGFNPRDNFDFYPNDEAGHASTYVDRTGKIIEHKDDGDSNIYLVLNPENGLRQNWIIGTERFNATYNEGDRILRGDLNAAYRNNPQALPSEFRTGIEIVDFEARTTDLVFWPMEFLQGGGLIKLNKYLKKTTIFKIWNQNKSKKP